MKSFLFIIAIILIVILYFENNSIIISNYKIKNKRIPKEFNGFRIVHISDLHSKVFYHNNNGFIEKIKNQKPEIIVITGDIINRGNYKEKKAIEFIHRIKSIAPIYFVAGNHEGWSQQFESLSSKLREEGVTVLRNQKVDYKRENAKISILGVDDPSFNTRGYSEGHMDNGIMVKQIEKINKGDNFKVLLSHRPELFEIYARENIDLVFTGHAHGGQFILPYLGGLVAPNQGFLPKYYRGTYKKNKTTMVVSRGIGGKFQRIGNKPEIVVVNLISE